MKMSRLLTAAAALFFAFPALAQNAGTVTNHAFAIGKGAGGSSYTSLLCTSAQLAVGQAAADPICRTVTGDVTIDAAGVTAIGANKVTNAQIRQSGALSLVGRSANSTGNVADISATPASSCVFLESASTLTCANIATANIAASAVTYAKMQNVTAARLLGNPTGGAAAPSEISLGATLTFSGTALQTLALTGDVTSAANSFATTIAANAVTNAKMATMAANTVKANATGSTAVPTDHAVPSCSSANQALNWTSGTGLGCVTIAGSGGGVWSNTRLAKTAAYTTVTGDCSDTLALGGSASFAVTFNAPSGYAATCAFLALNEDTSFGKLLLPQLATSATSFTIGTGSKAFTTTASLPINVYATASSTQRYRVYSLANTANYMSGTVTAYSGTTLTILVDTVGGSGTFTDWQIAPEIRLWPGQSRLLFAQNNVWKLDNPTRWKLQAATEICVDAASGSDSNDGLGTGTRCFKTIQFASNIVYQEWDANNFDPNIGLYTGPFNESVNIQGQITGYNFIRYRTRAANTWSNTATCIAVSDNAEAIFDAIFGFTQTWNCNTSNTANTGAIYGHQLNVIDIGGAHKWIAGGTNDSFLFEDGEGRATINGTGAGIIIGNSGVTSGYTFVNCSYHCAGVTIGGTLSYGGTLSLAAWLIASGGSVISHSANPTGVPGTIGVALSLGNSVIRLNGLTPPGGTPTASFQGVCATTC